MNYIWIILIAIYILSPMDAVPGLIDDILAGIALFYYLNKNAKGKQQFGGRTGRSRSHSHAAPGAEGPLTVEEAYKILGVGPGSTVDEISRAYKDKMRMSHPDKVSHLSEELQEKAKELTLKLNEAYDLLKKGKR